MSDGMITALVFAGLGAVAIGLILLNVIVADRRLMKWSVQTGHQIVWKQRRWLRCGPFTMRWSEGRIIYRLCIRRADGLEQLGWAACATGLFPIGDIVNLRVDSTEGFPVIVK